MQHLATLRSEISDNKAKVVNTDIQINTNISKDFSVRYTQGELVYLILNERQEHLQPVFRLSTEGFYSSSRTTALLEALKDQSYK